MLTAGDSIDDLMREFPDLEREDMIVCHEFARRMLTAKSVHLGVASFLVDPKLPPSFEKIAARRD